MNPFELLGAVVSILLIMIAAVLYAWAKESERDSERDRNR